MGSSETVPYLSCTCREVPIILTQNKNFAWLPQSHWTGTELFQWNIHFWRLILMHSVMYPFVTKNKTTQPPEIARNCKNCLVSAFIRNFVSQITRCILVEEQVAAWLLSLWADGFHCLLTGFEIQSANRCVGTYRFCLDIKHKLHKFSLYREVIHVSELVEYGLLKHKETSELLATDRNVIPDKK